VARNRDNLKLRDASVSISGSAPGSILRLTTGHAEEWPGITLVAPDKSWDLSGWASIVLTVRNPGSRIEQIFCRVDNAGANGASNCLTGSLMLNPGITTTLRMPLVTADEQNLKGTLSGMWAFPTAPGGFGAINPKAITQIRLFARGHLADFVFEVLALKTDGRSKPLSASLGSAFLPFVDSFGQYKHTNWPGKTTSEAGLIAAREAEEAVLRANPGPKAWDRYGGWAAGPKLPATGFFRRQKYEQKWWLVDPEGYLFFSAGVDSVGHPNPTFVERREPWFENAPWERAELKQFLEKITVDAGPWAGRASGAFSFSRANLFRKYGATWQNTYPEVVGQRMRAWGLNTLGAWSDERITRAHKTPYTDMVTSDHAPRIQGSSGHWRRFPDVYDAAFAASLQRSAEATKGRSAGDPWCLGYFCDNEMGWGDDVSLAVAVLRSPPAQAAKREFVAQLRAKYGEILKLNRAWATTHVSWDALAESRQTPGPGAAMDLRLFYQRLAERYFQLARDAIKAVAPNQLFLGCRFGDRGSTAAEAAAAKFCDVVSLNVYTAGVAGFVSGAGTDVPLLVGEFHFGALDRGLFHGGLSPMATQEDRALAYTTYLREALRHPQFVGCHWFQYEDQPLIGRAFDGENFQIGFVDVADTPYRELTDASRKVADQMYQLRANGETALGSLPP